MKQILQNFKRVTWQDPFEIAELMSSIITFAIGIWFLTHHDLYENVSVYGPLDALALLYIWGIGLMTLASWRVVGIAIDRHIIRKWTALAACIMWFFVSFTFYRGNEDSLEGILAAVFSAMSFYEFIRHAFNQKIRRESKNLEKLKKDDV